MMTAVVRLKRGDVIRLDDGTTALVKVWQVEPECNCICVYCYDHDTIGYDIDADIEVLDHKNWIARLITKLLRK